MEWKKIREQLRSALLFATCPLVGSPRLQLVIDISLLAAAIILLALSWWLAVL